MPRRATLRRRLFPTIARSAPAGRDQIRLRATNRVAPLLRRAWPPFLLPRHMPLGTCRRRLARSGAACGSRVAIRFLSVWEVNAAGSRTAATQPAKSTLPTWRRARSRRRVRKFRARGFVFCMSAKAPGKLPRPTLPTRRRARWRRRVRRFRAHWFVFRTSAKCAGEATEAALPTCAWPDGSGVVGYVPACRLRPRGKTPEATL